MQEPQLYKKRAAFVLIAASVIHDKKLENDRMDGYLELIMRYADDERDHVKKAASSALKEIGKKDFHYNEKALLLANEWVEKGNKVQRWIGTVSYTHLLWGKREHTFQKEKIFTMWRHIL